MQITEALAQMGGFRSIAQKLGITEVQVSNGAEALIPAIMNGLKQQAPAQAAGSGGLTGLLGQILGSGEASDTIAQQAAAKTGLDQDLLKKMLPMLTALVAGWLVKQNSGAGSAAESPAAGGSDALGSVMQLAGKFLR